MTHGNEETQELERGLSSRHLELMAIGGSIGTGLFMGSGKMISVTGPAMLVVYLIIGFVVFLVMRALGELLLSNLHYRTFGEIAKDLIGPWAGFFVSWTYWFSWTIGCVADIIAITGYISWFSSSISPWIPAAIAAAVLLVLNLLPVRFFGEVEFWFALVKIVAIVGLIVTGLVMMVSGFQNPETHTAASVSHLWDRGGVFPFGVSGFLMGFQMGIFSFIGVELVGTAATETKDPRKNLPKAINSMVLRILIFYVLALAVIMSITPWDEINPEASPFVTTLAYAGFGIAAVVINLVVIISAASSANSGVYSGGRMLFSLSHDKHAPRSFGTINTYGVPSRAVLATGLLLFTAVPMLIAGGDILKAFVFVSSVCSTMVLFTWGMITVSFIVFLRKFPEKHEASHFKMPLPHVAPWLILAFFGFILFTLIYGSDTRAATLCAPVWFAVLGLFWWRTKRKLTRAGRPLAAEIPADEGDVE